MGKYTAAAHAAANLVETGQGELCLRPANALVREFLLEARRLRLANAPPESGVDNLAGQMRRAADALIRYPYTVHDMASAQKVKGCGPAMARTIVDDLFSEYPPDPPDDDEVQAMATAEAVEKAAAAALRKRKKQEAAAAAGASGGAAAGRASGHAPAPAAVRAAAAAGPASRAGGQRRSSGSGEEVADGEDGGGGKRAKKAKGAPKEYIPALRSAPYAFLIVMLQAQKGPQRKQHFAKQELMDLTEASGISDKPINGDAASTRRTEGGQQWGYNGWNGFRKQIIVKGLAHEWSNPKKVSLTSQGFALAERLYRDGVERGILQPIQGIPPSGPLLFQLEEEAPGAAAAAAAGVPQGVLPSAGLQANRRLPAQQEVPLPRQQPSQQEQQQQRRRQVAPTAAPAARWQEELAAGGAEHVARRTAAGGASAVGYALGSGGAGGFAAAGGGAGYFGSGLDAQQEDKEGANDDVDYLSLPLAQRLQWQQAQQQQPRQQQQAPAVARGPAVGRASHKAATPGPGSRAAAGDVIDLLSDDSPSPLRRPGRAAAAAAAATAAAAAGGRGTALSAGGAAAAARLAAAAVPAVPAVPVVPDEHVAAMVGMGYSHKKARRALRKSLGEIGLPDIGRAVELAEALDSDAEGDSEDEAAGEEPARPAAVLPVPAAAAQRGGTKAARQGGATAATARSEAHGRQGQPQLPQRGQEQPAAAALDRGVEGPPVGGRVAPAVPAGRPTVGAARAGGVSGRGGGHIRAGSQQQAEEEEDEGLERQRSGAAAAAGPYDIAGFFSRLDSQVGGGSGDHGAAAAAAAAAAAGAGPGAGPGARAVAGSGLARSGSGSGGAAGAAAGPGVRQVPQDVRLPPLPPGRRFAEEYEVVMLIDQREQFTRINQGQGRGSALDTHLANLQKAGLAVEERQLPIGDAIWVARSRRPPATEYVLDFVVERKSCQDLVSSITGKGNRYEKQKYYLKRCGLRQVYYLVEGEPDLLPTEQQQKMVRSAGASVEVVDGFTLLRTADHHCSFRLFQRLTCRIQDWYRDLGPGSRAVGQLPTFAAWKEQCSANAEGTMTLHDLWGCMLGAVPSLGPDAIQAVLAHYPTPLHLYRAYQETARAAARRGEDGHRAAERVLYGIKAAGSSAKAIGPDKAARIYNCLFKQRVLGGGRDQ